MKKFLPLITLLLPITLFGQVKFGPEMGVNMAMMNQTTKFGNQSTRKTSDISPGIRAGVNVDIKVVENFYIQTGAFYQWNNIKFSDEIDLSFYNLSNAKQIRKYSVNSFQIPVYAMYKSGFEGNGRFFIGAGPYFGYTFNASQKNKMPSTPLFDEKTGKYSYSTTLTEYDLSLGDNPQTDQLLNMDYGLNATMGYESSVGLYFRGNFNYGLANVTPGASKDNFRRNWGFGLSIGVLLGKDNW